MDNYFQWQYPTRFEPVSTEPETPGLDKWFQPLSEPVLPPEELAEHPSLVFSVLPLPIAPDQTYTVYPDFIHALPDTTHTEAVSTVEPVITVPDQWVPSLDLPPADFARLQYMYPSVFIDEDFSSIPPAVAGRAVQWRRPSRYTRSR